MNRLVLNAALQQVATVRYTPAGVPALDMVLMHQSQVVEMGVNRVVTLEIRAQLFGAHAETLSRQPLGQAFEFQGFLAPTRNGKGVVFHIQEFTKI